MGHVHSTYQGDGNPLPPFAGEPIPVELKEADAGAFADKLWDALNAENRIALYVRFRDLQTGQIDAKLLNKFT